MTSIKGMATDMSSAIDMLFQIVWLKKVCKPLGIGIVRIIQMEIEVTRY